jgi:hypothetical protein
MFELKLYGRTLNIFIRPEAFFNARYVFCDKATVFSEFAGLAQPLAQCTLDRNWVPQLSCDVLGRIGPLCAACDIRVPTPCAPCRDFISQIGCCYEIRAKRAYASMARLTKAVHTQIEKTVQDGPNDSPDTLLSRLVKALYEKQGDEEEWFDKDWIRQYITGVAVAGSATVARASTHAIDRLRSSRLPCLGKLLKGKCWRWRQWPLFSRHFVVLAALPLIFSGWASWTSMRICPIMRGNSLSGPSAISPFLSSDCLLHASTHFLEQLLGRAALPLRQLGFLLQNLRQNFNPLAELRRWLNSPRVFELRLWPRMTLRTVARDADSIRTISLTERSCSK